MGISRFLLLLAALLPLTAQEFRATLTGRVLDPHGAPIAGASVTIKNTGTNSTQQTRTDTQGNYSAAFLQPGDYAVTVEAAGFKKELREGISLTIGQAATLELRLELGAVTQQVTVSGEAPLLDNGTAERGGLIDEESVKEFPLNGRNPFMLSMLVPGVDYNGNIAYQRPFDNGAIGTGTSAAAATATPNSSWMEPPTTHKPAATISPTCRQSIPCRNSRSRSTPTTRNTAGPEVERSTWC